MTVHDDFEALYNQYATGRWPKARAELVGTLREILDASVPKAERHRFRVEEGRIKTRNRVWLKAESKYSDSIPTAGDIFEQVTDIVATRITTNTLQDAYSVMRWLRANCDSSDPDCTMHLVGEDDYVESPKKSGYRALHADFMIKISEQNKSIRVRCEVQVRTLLQDAWGELTHEDTYRPEVQLPKIAESLSKRLATVLAVMDELAQDLSDELNRSNAEIGEQLLKGPPTDTIPESTTHDGESMRRDTIEPSDADLGRQVADEIGGDAEILTGLIEMDRLIRGTRISGNALRQAIPQMAAEIERWEAAHEDIGLDESDLTSLLFACAEDPVGTIHSQLTALAQRRAEARRLAEEWSRRFAVGQRFFGTVTFVRDDYALVQIDDGETGILHARQIAADPHDYIDVNEYVVQGATIGVEIIESDVTARRTAFKLAEVDSGT